MMIEEHTTEKEIVFKGGDETEKRLVKNTTAFMMILLLAGLILFLMPNQFFPSEIIIGFILIIALINMIAAP
ncbi:MAG: hypothetical protein HZB92_01530 [Euryarchaeota archaeon]|nr:hypothetical protein [Euryarchaeota archaeon]